MKNWLQKEICLPCSRLKLKFKALGSMSPSCWSMQTWNIKKLIREQSCLPRPGQLYHSLAQKSTWHRLSFTPPCQSLYHPGTLSTALLIHPHFQGHYPQSNSWGNVSVVLSVLPESDDTQFLYLDLPTWSAHPFLASAKFKSNREYYNRVNNKFIKFCLGGQLMCVIVLSIRPKSL